MTGKDSSTTVLVEFLALHTLVVEFCFDYWNLCFLFVVSYLLFVVCGFWWPKKTHPFTFAGTTEKGSNSHRADLEPKAVPKAGWLAVGRGHLVGFHLLIELF